MGRGVWQHVRLALCAWALRETRMLFAFSVVFGAVWTAASPAERWPFSVFFRCSAMFLAVLAGLTTTTHEDGPSSIDLTVSFRLCCAVPASEVYTLIRRDHKHMECFEDFCSNKCFVVVFAIHISHFLVLVMGVAALDRGLMTVWECIRSYLVFIGLDSLCAALYVRSIGGTSFPAPGGMNTFAVCVLCSSLSLILAACFGPSMRRRVLELWTLVPLSTTSLLIMHTDDSWQAGRNSVCKQSEHSEHSHVDSHCSESLGSTFLVEDTDQYMDLHML